MSTTVNSRTKNSMRNSMSAMLYYVVNMLLNFVSRKIFLDHLGSEVLGLNTTATNLLQFLNLAELGVSMAISFSLYKPLAKKDYDVINDIINLQGKIYKRVACFLIVGAIIISFFFPLIFHKMALPLWYAYASFGILLFSSLLSYFVNYRQVLLTANQQDYKITFSYKVCLLLKVITQIVVISIMKDGYVWWLITEFIFSIIASMGLNRVIKKNHPYVKDSDHSYKTLKRKYPEITIKIKQLFFHKIAAFAVTQTSPLIIYAFLDLSTVAYYGNYMMVIHGLSLLLTSFFNGVGASVGNLISYGDKERILSVFDELFCIRFLLAMSVSICLFYLGGDFITLWIGKQYMLPQSTLILMIISMYFSLSRGVVDTFINGYGLYKDIWAPITEAIINLGGSILGGYYFGLNGIIIGVIVSQIVILFFWKPYFLFTYGIRIGMRNYISLYGKCIVAGIVGVSVSWYVSKIMPFLPSVNFLYFILGGIVYLICSILIIGGIEWLLTDGMRNFIRRVLHQLIR